MELGITPLNLKNSKNFDEKVTGKAQNVLLSLSSSQGGAPVLRPALGKDTVSFSGGAAKKAGDVVTDGKTFILNISERLLPRKTTTLEPDVKPVAEIVPHKKQKKAEKPRQLYSDDVEQTNETPKAPKSMKSHAFAVNYDLAKKVYDEALPAFDYFSKGMKKYFGSLQTTFDNLDLPLAAGHEGMIIGMKKAASICEKTASKGLRNKAEIKKDMSDIIRGRLVLRDASPKAIESLMKELTRAVKDGYFEVFEIENYRLEPQYSYVPNKLLNAFQKLCDKKSVNGCSRVDSSIKSGYPALHLSVKLPNGYRGEIQIMGVDVQRVKELEDLIYKVKNNKSLISEYKPLEDHLAPLKGIEDKTDDASKSFLRSINTYTQEQYISARLAEPLKKKSNRGNKFLPANGYVEPKYDFNELYRIKLECDRNANKAKN